MSGDAWRPIPGFEAEYEASTLGRIRSTRRILTNSLGVTRPYGGTVLRENTFGPRALVTLSKGGRAVTRAVHLLVCESFHGPKPADKDLAAHWDGDGWNNRPENLRWATFEENEEDKRRHGRHAAGERNPSVKLSAAQVAEIRGRHDGRRGIGRALAREFGVSPTQISAIHRGQCWSDEGNAARRERRAA